jgi:hypothetical protein
MNLTVGGRTYRILIDTGASLSIISENFWKQIKTPLLSKFKNPTVLTVTGQPVKILGITYLLFDELSNQKFPISIVGNIETPVIIGMDLLRKGDACLDIQNNVLKWFDVMFPLSYIDHVMTLSEIHEIPEAAHPEIQLVLRRFSHLFGPLQLHPTLSSGIVPATITTHSPPIKQKAYRLPLNKRKVVENCIDEMLEANIIRPSSSPWASPITLVDKKDGGTRFCVDYRQLNAVTIKDAHPLPNIQDIFDQLAGGKVFSTLDLRSGYHQIPVHEDDVEKTAFTTHVGLFEFVRLPFGLCNAPAIFQRIMNRVLHGLIGKICFVYIDDIIIFSSSVHEHAAHLELVMARLAEAGLHIKASKCKIEADGPLS